MSLPWEGFSQRKSRTGDEEEWRGGGENRRVAARYGLTIRQLAHRILQNLAHDEREPIGAAAHEAGAVPLASPLSEAGSFALTMMRSIRCGRIAIRRASILKVTRGPSLSSHSSRTVRPLTSTRMPFW